ANALAVVTVIAPTPSLIGTFTVSPSSPSVGTAVTFTSSVSGGTPPYFISWNFGDTFTGTGSVITHSYSAPGNYQVTMSVSDSGSPQLSTTFTTGVTVQQPPRAQLTAAFSWSPTIPIVLQPTTFTATVTGGTAPYSYGWNFGD